MANDSNTEVNLQQLFAKLGHNLEEIRVRALQNILSKLEHNLLCDADLAQEKHLHIRLLEWFNFPSCPHQDTVLDLVLCLAQNSSAAKIYLDIGAVEFLTQLRPNVGRSLHIKIDAILNRLFHLPSVDSFHHHAECIYQPQIYGAQTNDSNVSNGVAMQHSSEPQYAYFASSAVNAGNGRLQGQDDSVATDQPVGYFINSVDSARHLNLAGLRREPVMVAKCFKFATFPWVALTPTDRHILSSTDESIRSKDAALVLSVCDFLTDVVFQDFPAEVFLQRPNIVQSLLSLLSLTGSGSSDNEMVVLRAISTLMDLTVGLGVRIYFCQDPTLFTPKHDYLQSGFDAPLSHTPVSQRSFSSTETQSSFAGRGEARHRGDGQDIDSSSSSTMSFPAPPNGYTDMIEQTDLEDICSLQFIQWTVVQYCMALLDKLIPCLKSVVNEQFALQCLRLAHQVVVLLKRSVLPDTLWGDESFPARELIDKFHDILESLGEAIFSCHHTTRGTFAPESAASLHRIIFIGLSSFTAELLEAVVPVDKARVALPKEFSSVLTVIYQDHSLSYSFPDLIRAALNYAVCLDTEGCEFYYRLQDQCVSLAATCKFLSKFQELSDETAVTLLDLAEQSLISLSHHQNLTTVECSIQLASYVCSSTAQKPALVEQARHLVLSLLSYPLEDIRIRAHVAVTDIIKDALDVKKAVQMTSSSTLRVCFLLDTKIIYQLCCFSMTDVQQIQDLTQQTLLNLLQCQLLVPTARWQQLIDALVPILPAIQCWSNVAPTLGTCILGLLETDSRVMSGTLPTLQRLRGSMCLTFHADARVRGEGIQRTLKLLSLEEGCSKKLPSLADVNARNLTDLFVVKSPKILFGTGRAGATDDRRTSLFQAGDVKKVYDILISEAVDVSIRKSAVDQLGIIMQDLKLHDALVRLLGVEKLLSLLQSGLTVDTNNKRSNLSQMLPPIVTVLKCVAQTESVREKLVTSPQLYSNLFRCAVLHQWDESTRKDVTELLAFILFHEMAATQTWHDRSTAQGGAQAEFSLPYCLSQKYLLPFKAHEHHMESPWSAILPSDLDSVEQSVQDEALSISWNVAWHDGIDALLAATDSTGKDAVAEKMLSSKLLLSPTTRTVLSTSYVSHALRQCLRGVENATTHSAVSAALLRLCSYVVCTRSTDIGLHLHSVKWRDSIARFLMITPSSTADELLLIDIIHFLHLVITHSPSSLPPETLEWLADMLLHPKGAMHALLAQTDASLAAVKGLPESALHSKRQLNRELLKFVESFIGGYPYRLSNCNMTSRCVHGDLVKSILGRINRADAVQSYNLSSLELTLLCLMQITARPGWSLGSATSDSLSLCIQMLQSLLEVVSAFHIGRGGLSMSYMGRGITRCATMCLRHLAHEMSIQLHSQDWPRNWLFSRQAAGDSVGESGMYWLFPLWSYRDIEVRVAGVGIAAALTSTESGRITMTTQCHNIPGGIWGTALSLLLDETECSLARQQAALLLVNLTSQPLPHGDTQTADIVWHGPVVMNEETQVSLVGLSALLVLLHHTQFYEKIRLLFSCYYVDPTIYPVNVQQFSDSARLSAAAATAVEGITSSTAAAAAVASLGGVADLNTLGSQITITTSDSITPVNSGRSGRGGGGALIIDTGRGTVPSSANSSLQRSANEVVPPSVADDSRDSGAPAATQKRHVTGEGGGQNTVTASRNLARDITTDDSAASQDSSDRTIVVSSSVVTPCLISAVSALLSNLINLAPDETIACLVNENITHCLLRLLDVRLLEAFISNEEKTRRSSTECGRYTVALMDLLAMHRDVINLMRLCTSRSEVMRNQLLSDQQALKQIALLLKLSCQDDADVSSLCTSVWVSVLALLSNLLILTSQDAFIAMSPVVAKNWSIIGGRAVLILQDKSLLDSDLWLLTLNFLSLLFTEESKFKVVSTRSQKSQNVYCVSELLDSTPTANESSASAADLLSFSSSGAFLCQALVQTLDIVLLKPHDHCNATKVAAINALKAVLALSLSAKMAALEAGLMETLCEHIRRLHNRIDGDMLEQFPTHRVAPATKKKISTTVSELALIIELLTNFLYDNQEVKVCACKNGLSNLVHLIWTWCQLEPGLMSCVLSLLSNYTARCPQACSSLAFTSTSTAVAAGQDKSSALKPVHSSNSLMHCIIRLLQKESHGENLALLKQAFTLTSTLALSQECRGVLWKSNFLHEFSGLQPKTSTRKTEKKIRPMYSLWLALFVNLSFSSEGQNMILKIDDSVMLLIEFGFSGEESLQRSALLVLRNLSFQFCNKPKLLANDKLIPLLLKSIEFGSSEMRTITCSMILNLIYNNQKAKGVLKNTGVLRKLQDAYNNFVEISSDVEWADNCSQMLKDVLLLIDS